MAQEIIEIEVRARNISSAPHYPIFAAHVGERLIQASSDLRAFAISLACRLCQMAQERETRFILESELEKGQSFKYTISNPRFKPPNEYDLQVRSEKLPPPRTLSRKFYNWFSGKSGSRK